MAVKDRFDLALPNIPGPVVAERNMASNAHYRFIGNPNGQIPAYIGASGTDESTNEEWQKMSDHGGATGWVRDEDDSDVDVISTGTTTARSSADRWAEVRNVKDFGVVADGTTDDYTRLVAALAAVDVLRITGVIRIGTNLTIASGKVLIFEKGGKLKPSSGIKITITGEVQAGRFEIFDYTAGGKCVLTFFGKTDFMYPEWWGAEANSSTDNVTAFGRMLDTTLTVLENAQPIDLCQGYYIFSSAFTGKQNMVMRGNASGKTRLILTATVSGPLLILDENAASIELSYIQFHSNTTAAGIRTTAIRQDSGVGNGLSHLIIRQCDFTNWNQYAIDIEECQYLLISDQTRFLSISNLVSQGGTGSGPAVCLNVRTYCNGANISDIRVGTSDKFANVVFASGMTFQNSNFEQSDTTTDATSVNEHYIQIAGRAFQFVNNYVEGIKTSTLKGIVSLEDCLGYTINGNTFELARPGSNTAVTSDVVHLEATATGGVINGNTFSHTPLGYYVKTNSLVDTPQFNRNTFLDNDGLPIASYATIANSLLPASIEFDTSNSNNLTKPQSHRTFDSATTAIAYPWSDYHVLNSGTAAAGLGVGRNFYAENTAAAQEQIGSMDFRWTVATSTAEVSNWRLWVCNASAIAVGLETFGAGGTRVRGNVMPTCVLTATSIAATQASGHITVNATGQTITLPNSTTTEIGTTITIKLAIGGAGSCTVAAAGSDTIDGAASYSLSADFKYVTVRLSAEATNWDIIANN